MGLLSLSNELLSQIIEETMPEGFGNIILTCKVLYQVGQPFFESHATLLERYRHFSFGGDGSLSNEDDCATSLQLLLRIAENPRIARYIISADFKEDHIALIEDHIDAEHTKALFEYAKHSAELRHLLNDSSYLRDIGADASEILKSLSAPQPPTGVPHFNFILALVLTLLPNVVSLSLPRTWNEYCDQEKHNKDESPWCTTSLLDAIVERANDSHDLDAGLSRLTSILPSTGGGYENRWTLSNFNAFLSIVSVRNFVAGSTLAIDDGYTGQPFTEPTYDTFGDGLKTIELFGAVVDAEELGKFLSKLPSLNTFRLSYETKWHGCGHDMDSSGIVTAIGEAVGDRLVELSFSVLECFGDFESRVLSLKNFPKLKRLEFDLAVVVGDSPEIVDDLPRMSEFCPSSIEVIHLLVPDFNKHSRALQKLFSEDSAQMTKQLPHLRQIEVRVLLKVEPSLAEGEHKSRQIEMKSCIRNWTASLLALDTPIEVDLVVVEDHAWPRWMREFGDRYGVDTEGY